MTAAQRSLPSGKVKLITCIAAFAIVLVVLLTTAGLGNATHTPEARVPMTVSTGIVKIQQSFETSIDVFGLIESPRATLLSFDRGGQILQITAEEGDVVAKGDVLAQQDIARLQARQQELKASLTRANADLMLAKVNSQRTIALVDKKLESAQRLDEAEAMLNVALAQVAEIEAAITSLAVEIDKAQLIAPFNGVVDARQSDEGAVVMAGSPVLGITSTDDYQARFAIPADVIDQFEVNESVLMRVGDHEVNGIVVQRLPTRDVQTRTIDILVTLNSNNHVRPGDMAILSGTRSHAEIGVWLPVNALSNGLRGLWRVFVVSDGKETEIEGRIVEVIYTDGRNAFVRGALKNGDVYVTEGTHKLAPGQVVSLSSHKQLGVR